VRGDRFALGALAMLLVFAALAILAASADAAGIYVPRTHRTIQAGIDAAAEGDTVFVAPGTYTGPFLVRRNIVLFSALGADTTVLDGGGAARVLDVEGTKGGAIVGFTIRNGKANSGGGIRLYRVQAFLVAGNIFEKNWESAVSIWQSQNVDLRDCRFVENDGSAVSLNESAVLIRSCEFLRNRGYAGGAIAFNRSRLLFPMRGCNFEGNRADGASGGAIFADSSEVQIVEGWFEKNTAKVAGGAISVVRDSRVALSRNRLFENEAPAGGAVQVDRATLVAGLCVFDKNRATAVGAAIAVVGRGSAGVNPILQSNTFYRNSSTEGGATIWAEHVSPEIRQNIFDMESNQRAFRGLDSSPLFECNLIHDPSGAALASLPSVDTLVGDPRFCEPEKGDYYLSDLSPALLAACGPIGALPKKCNSFKMVPAR
jgi:predicted outer membrane repeat protein